MFGVYRTGGAYREHKQEAYDQEIDSIFGAFDKVSYSVLSIFFEFQPLSFNET